MNRSNTQTISIAAPPEQVFDFVANPETLPVWAVGFCRHIRPDGTRWIVTTAHGEMPIRVATDRACGTIDFYFSPAPDAEMAAFSRVVPNGRGSEYVFTQFQGADMPAGDFEAQVAALGEELLVLRGVIQARLACPA